MDLEIGHIAKDIKFSLVMLTWQYLVREVLAERGIICEKVCPICREQDESIIHLFHECKFARDVWRKLVVPPSHVSSFANNFEVWLKNNCLS